MTIEARLAELGIALPEAAAPVAGYVPVVVAGGLAHVSGQLPFIDGALVTGRLGEDVDVERGYAAARACGLMLLAQLKAALGSSTAAVKRAELSLQRTRITAPFAGIMETRDVEVGDLMDMGGKCASLLDDTPMLLTGLVAEQDVGKLALGAPVSATLLSGESVTGKVTYVSRAADSTSRSYAIEVEIDPTEQPIRQGITAEIYIAASETQAHLVPASALTMDDAGLVGIKHVDASNLVHFAPVTIVGENTSVDPGMWVTGLPASVLVITHGQEVVFDGQTVVPDSSWSTL